MGFYHLIIYGIRRTERSILFAGLFALFIAVRTFILSDYLVDLLLPIKNWEVQTKLEYLTELAGFISLVLLILQMYPKEVHKSMVRVTFVVVVLYGRYILLTPVRVFTQSLIIQAAILVFILLYYVFFVGIKAALRKDFIVKPFQKERVLLAVDKVLL
jgi:hypothetical protein